MEVIATILTISGIIAIIILVDRAETKAKEAREQEYYNSTYYSITHHSYNDVYRDDGKWQEWQIAQKLAPYEQTGAKLLFNAYIPKYNGTTELDVIMITPYGLFVFESKNYSGWIFGNANQRNWVQVLRTGRYSSQKEYFYNPIKQNETHINCLRRLLRYNVPIHSVIVFSNRCEFRDVDIGNADVDVLHLRDATYTVRYVYEHNQVRLKPDAIQELYDALYPYTQVSDEMKEAHIRQTKSYHQ